AEPGAGRQVTFERGKSIRTRAHLRSVEPHRAVHIDAVKLDDDLLPGARVWQSKGLSVPAEATIEVATAWTGRGALVERQRNAPVMWNIEARPGRIVESRSLRVAYVPEMELPRGVEAHRGLSRAVVGVNQCRGG